MSRQRTRPPLTRLEADVMRAVWATVDDQFRVRDVVTGVNRGRRRKLAYNTVQSMLTILREKGYVSLVDSTGRAHLFKALISRDEASRHMVAELARRLFGGRIKPLLHQLIDETLDEDALRELRERVDARLRDKKADR